MWINIKILLNSLSSREFILSCIFILSIFLYLFYDSILPKWEIYQNNNKLLKIQAKNSKQYFQILNLKKNILTSTTNKEEDTKRHQLSSSLENNKSTHINKTFKDKAKFLLWLCDTENKILIKNLDLNHTDIKNLIKVNVQGRVQNMEQKVCLFKNDFNLSDIFYNQTYIVSSIIGGKVKLNDKWYSKNDKISENIFLKEIKSSYIRILQDNKLKKVFLSEKF